MTLQTKKSLSSSSGLLGAQDGNEKDRKHLDTIRQKLYEQKNKIGLVGGTIKINEFDDAEHNVSAGISPQGWDIEISVRKGFNPVSDKRQKAYARKKKIQDGLETLLGDVALHEFAHWELPHGSERGCPYDVYNHDKILEAVESALPQDKKAMAGYVANAFEDTIINPRCHEFRGDFGGQVLFWDNEGLSAKERGQKAFTPIYEAFVKLNMHLFGDGADRALLKRHYTKDKKVDEAVKKVIEDLSLPENIKDTSRLFDRTQWATMAGAFARDLADLLDVKPTERTSAYSSGGEGSEGQKPKAGNGIEQKMGTREGKEEVAFGRYAGNDKHSPHFTSYGQLDSVYQRLARSIPVKVEAVTREQNLAISPLNYRPFDHEKDDPAKVKASKIFVDEQGIRFGYPNQPLVISARSKVQKRSFPDFKFVMLDNSGSMKFAIDGSRNVGNTTFIPWGDRSKYHFALLGLYGVENFLQRQGIAQYINHGMSLFSSQTRYREAGFSGLDNVRKLALAPDWGSTNLDAQVLKDALRGRESFALSISDGEIGNWDSVKGDFQESTKGNYYAHIQIGGETDFTRDLKSWGVPVFQVTSGEQLSRLIVDITRNTYGRFTHQ